MIKKILLTALVFSSFSLCWAAGSRPSSPSRSGSHRRELFDPRAPEVYGNSTPPSQPASALQAASHSSPAAAKHWNNLGSALRMASIASSLTSLRPKKEETPQQKDAARASAAAAHQKTLKLMAQHGDFEQAFGYHGPRAPEHGTSHQDTIGTLAAAQIQENPLPIRAEQIIQEVEIFRSTDPKVNVMAKNLRAKKEQQLNLTSILATEGAIRPMAGNNPNFATKRLSELKAQRERLGLAADATPESLQAEIDKLSKELVTQFYGGTLPDPGQLEANALAQGRETLEKEERDARWRATEAAKKSTVPSHYGRDLPAELQHLATKDELTPEDLTALTKASLGLTDSDLGPQIDKFVGLKEKTDALEQKLSNLMADLRTKQRIYDHVGGEFERNQNKSQFKDYLDNLRKEETIPDGVDPVKERDRINAQIQQVKDQLQKAQASSANIQAQINKAKAPPPAAGPKDTPEGRRLRYDRSTHTFH